MFEFTIDLGLKISYDSCRKGNILKLVSSAYILVEPTLKQFGRSFIESLYRPKREGGRLLTLEVRHNLQGLRSIDGC